MWWWIAVPLAAMVLCFAGVVVALWRHLRAMERQPQFSAYEPAGHVAEAAQRIRWLGHSHVWSVPEEAKRL